MTAMGVGTVDRAPRQFLSREARTVAAEKACAAQSIEPIQSRPGPGLRCGPSLLRDVFYRTGPASGNFHVPSRTCCRGRYRRTV